MTRSPALQELSDAAAVTPAAGLLAGQVLDAVLPLDRAFELVAQHLLTLDRVEAVTIALTSFTPENDSRWTHLGGRAWVIEWSRPGSTCSALPSGDRGPEAALSLPWVSPRARQGVVAIIDVDMFPTEADQDRYELTSCGIRSMVVAAYMADGAMYGSLAMGGAEAGPWPEHHVADFRLLHAALTTRIALEQTRRSLAEAVAVGAQGRETHQHFLASLGHELRTPLSAIIGYTEMVLDEASTRADEAFAREVSHDGKVILRACEQLSAVIEDLLSAGRVVVEADLREPVDVQAAVADVIHWHRAAANSAGVELTTTVSPGLTVRAQPSGVRQVLANLVGNAVVHNVPGGRVTVSAEPLVGESGEPRLRVIVRDSGPGLTAEQLAHVFDPFIRYARPHVKGTGLGLSLSRTVAERDGGTVGAESTPGRGSAFWVELPVHAAPADSARPDALM